MEITAESAISKILVETGNTTCDKVPIRRDLTYYTLYKLLVLHDSFAEVASELGVTTNVMAKIMSRNIKPLFIDKPNQVKWHAYLLSLIDYKRCRECKKILPRGKFSKATEHWDSYAQICKNCRAIYRAIFTENNPNYNKDTYEANKGEYITRAIKYKTKRDIATPPWANITKIKEIYATCPEGYHVDHIIPLQGLLVSGLHVETNLRHLPAKENMQKHNKFQDDIPY